MRPPFAPCLFMALILAACSATETAMTQKTSTDDAQAEAGEQRAKHNPQPKQAYRITVTIANAPGPFASVQGVAQYDVRNDDQCGELNDMTGTRMRIASSEPFTLTKISDTEYQGTIYADLMQDEAYYTHDVCHWEFTEMRALLQATGADGETIFVTHVSAASITNGTPVTSFFWKGGYREKDDVSFPDGGADSPQKFKLELRDQLFSITLTPKGIAP